MKKLYVLDVSGYIFRAYFALPPMTGPSGCATHALFGFIRSCIKLFKDFDPDHIVAVFDGPNNKESRTKIYADYKANRDQIQEDLPEQIELAKTFCELMGIPHLEINGVEADDAMGSIARWAAQQDSEIYLCTSDKDLCQLVNEQIFVLNTWKDNLILDQKKVQEVFGVLPHQIIDYLAIVGDTSDNIPGLKGFGPKTAVTLLAEFGDLETLLANWAHVKGAKKQETLREDADIARLSYTLATINTTCPIPKEGDFYTLKASNIPALKAFYTEMGFHSLQRELEKLTGKEESVTYRLIETEEALIAALKELSHYPEIAFDVESTSLTPTLARLVGVGFSVKEQEALYVPLNGSFNPTSHLKKFFKEHSFFAHNGKYDLHVLKNSGIEVPNLSFDTILASYLLSSEGRRHSLDALALSYFGKVKTPIKKLIGSGKKQISMDDVPLKLISDYCCEDVDYTYRLKQILAQEIKDRQLTKLLFDLELPLMRVLFKMERAGMFVDISYLKELHHEVCKELAKITERIYATAGEAFNLNSPKQLSTILFAKMGIKPIKKTATGFSTKQEVLEILAQEHPICVDILVYRGLEKLRSTYLEALPEAVNPKTGRIHPTFNQFVAATGRLACQDPNLQNIPTRSNMGAKIRHAFKPEKKGWCFLSADYSQIELRLLAHLSEDPILIEAFHNNLDIHQHTASRMFEVPLDQVSKEQRYQAKAINFGIIYGQQAYGLSQELNISMKRAAAFIEDYFERYPRVKTYLDTCIQTAKTSGKATTLYGRERQIPEITSTNAMLRHAAERLAVNTPLQGTAADIIKYAMLSIDQELSSLESYMILQVHDELIFEVPDAELEKLKPLVKSHMENTCTLKVPLVVDIAIGKNWGEC